MTLGQHFTPQALARWLVERALSEPWSRSGPLRAVDPACGQGVFLEAIGDALGAGQSALELVGVDLDPVALDVARQRVPTAKLSQGDALAIAGRAPLREASFDLVALNPPYIGEKGNRSLFAEVADLSPKWRSRAVARMDYLYFFLHLGLDLLKTGGRMVALTTAYWPAATSARALRADLAQRGAIMRWIAFEGSPIFPGAPGQHNLAFIVEKVAQPAQRTWTLERVRAGRGVPETISCEAGHPPLDGASPWQPFIGAEDRRLAAEDAARWETRLYDLALDRQGVVSGCDRISARHRATLGPECPVGAPVFTVTGAEVVERGWHLDPEVTSRLEPLLRGSEVGRFDIRKTRSPLTAPGGLAMIYLTRKEPSPPLALLEHLRPYKALLSARREVKTGVMPWWALHWPRRLEQMRRPKIVTARRGKTMRFCLDLAGHVVSSDCTFILARSQDPRDLELLWMTLHLESVERALRANGKLKGGLMEFYSDPLRRLSLPIAMGPSPWKSLESDQLEALRAGAARSGLLTLSTT